MNPGGIKSFCAIFAIFCITTLFPFASCINYWEEDRSANTNNRRKYEALITGSTYAWNGRYCGGVIITTRYVLTVYACTRGDYGPAKKLQVHVGFTKINYMSDTPTNGIAYDVERVRNIQEDMDFSPAREYDDHYRQDGYLFLAIAITKVRMQFGSTVGAARVPDKPTWQHFDIRKAEVTSPLYKRVLQQEKQFEFSVMKGRRDCDVQRLKDIPIWLTPSCLDYRWPAAEKDVGQVPEEYWSPMGASLVYNNTVVAIKNHYARHPDHPYDKVTKYSLYINLAYYAKYMESYYSGSSSSS